MHVVITGGAGFLGRRLAEALLKKNTLSDASGTQQRISRLTLLDVAEAAGIKDPRVEAIAADVSDPAVIERIIGADTGAIFHLAAIVSGEAEANFELGMRINLDATRHILERVRLLGSKPRLLFASSIAVFGGELPARVRDDTAVTPQSSYGMQKAVGELLVNDYSRKGFVDGRALRLPTVTVRSGKPNKAASSFASGIIREPLSGVEAICPVSPETRMWLISPRRVVEGLIHGFELPGERYGSFRALSMPGLCVSVGDMVAALERVAGAETAARVKWQFDPVIDRIVSTWPGDFDAARGRALGFATDADYDSIVRAYIEDDMPK